MKKREILIRECKICHGDAAQQLHSSPLADHQDDEASKPTVAYSTSLLDGIETRLVVSILQAVFFAREPSKCCPEIRPCFTIRHLAIVPPIDAEAYGVVFPSIYPAVVFLLNNGMVPAHRQIQRLAGFHRHMNRLQGKARSGVTGKGVVANMLGR